MEKIFPEEEFVKKNYPAIYEAIDSNVRGLSFLQNKLLKIPEQIKGARIDFNDILLTVFDIGYNLGEIEEKVVRGVRKGFLGSKEVDLLDYYDIDNAKVLLKRVGKEVDRELLERLVENVGREKARAILGW